MVVKNGKRNGKQRYKCNDCGKRFDGRECLNSVKLWRLYLERKQTKKELADDFACSSKTISRYLIKHIKTITFPHLRVLIC